MNETCFGLRKGRECTILAGGKCHGNYNLCPFYKPKWKAEQDRKKAFRAIARMPMEKQREISEKYYQGESPWEREDL